MPDDDETPMTERRWEKMTPGEKMDYSIKHMADPEFRKWELEYVRKRQGKDSLYYKVLKGSWAWKVEKRKPFDPAKALKSFDPETVSKVLAALRTPATFSSLKNNKDRLNRSLAATSLRQYLDALLTRGYITITDVKFERRRDYPNNTIPRRGFSIYYISTKGGKKYVRLYQKVLDMLSELDPKGRMDRP
jgi:hypothetical protein